MTRLELTSTSIWKLRSVLTKGGVRKCKIFSFIPIICLLFSYYSEGKCSVAVPCCSWSVSGPDSHCPPGKVSSWFSASRPQSLNVSEVRGALCSPEPPDHPHRLLKTDQPGDHCWPLTSPTTTNNAPSYPTTSNQQFFYEIFFNN